MGRGHHYFSDQQGKLRETYIIDAGDPESLDHEGNCVDDDRYYDDFLENLQHDVLAAPVKSITPNDESHSRNERYLAQTNYCSVVVAGGEGGTFYIGCIPNGTNELIYRKQANIIMDHLFSCYPDLRVRAGAWCSGPVKKGTKIFYAALK